MAIKRNKIEKYLKNPVSVRVYDAVDSTNNEAKRRAGADNGRPMLYVTDCQTAGRGRRGHDFYSPKGSGLYFTLSLPLSGDPADVQPITCAAAVAVCEAIAVLTDKEPQVKWVNDILIGGKKVAGILAELVTDAQNQPIAVIVGIGINLTTGDFPAEFAAKAGSIGDVDPNRLCAEITDRLTEYAADVFNSNSELKTSSFPTGEAPLIPPKAPFGKGDSPDRGDVRNADRGVSLSRRGSCHFARKMTEGLQNCPSNASNHFNSILEKYRQLSLCLGREIQYTDGTGVHTATALDIAPDGSLIVEENGDKKSLHSGEISIGSLW